MAERRIIVKESRVVASGTKNGRDWTIYELSATREDHTPLPTDMKLRCFDDLPLNEVLDVVVTKYHSEEYGDSYTVSRKGKGNGGGGLANEVAELRRQMAAMQEQIDQMAARVFGGGNAGEIAGATPADSPSDLPTTAPSSAGSPAGVVPTDDDIPF